MLIRWICVVGIFIGPCAVAQELNPDVVELGRQLFHETRFSNPGSDMEVSCASCHALTDPLGSRAFTELFQRSWHPWRNEDPGRETIRNTPTLLDVGQHAFIHFDGEFQTLEEQAVGTYTGRNFGWLPGEEASAYKRIAWVFGENSTLSGQFEKVVGTPYSEHSSKELVQHMAKATADFMRTLKSRFDSPYDKFIQTNGIAPAPADGQTAKQYAGTILERLYALETSKKKLELVEGFGEDALEGYRIFMRTDGQESVGNCVACHVPPLFMDHNYHNTGVSQMEYERVHGVGTFREILIPPRKEGVAPPKRFGSSTHRSSEDRVDLGHWNFARMETSPMVESGDTSDAFFSRTVAAFKTPTLRHLGSTDPYMHSGEYDYVAWSLMQKEEAAFLARMGLLRNGDHAMKKVYITHKDILALVAFLNTLNDSGERQIMEAPVMKIESSYNGSRQSKE